MASLNYLGKGEKYPLTPNVNNGITLVEGVDLLKQSMEDILATPRGTRFAIEDYGSDLHLLNFTQNDAVLHSLLVLFIAEALFKWEKRIRVLDITPTNQGESAVHNYIEYRILASNEIDAFVYPFYKELKY